MNKIILLLIFTACYVLGSPFAGAVHAGTLDKALLAGLWTGPLTVPGGSREVSITVSHLPNGTTSAVLHMAASGLNNSPMRVISSADSVVFYADQMACRFVAQPVADGHRLRGQWQQPGFRTMLVLDRVRSTMPLVAAPAAAVATTAAYKMENVRVGRSSNNTELAGLLSAPFGAGPFPAVVLLADAEAVKEAHDGYNLLNELADYLTRQGIAVLRLDQGKSASLAAAGTTTADRRVADAYSALNFLRTRPGIDPLRVGLLGHGQGANIALRAATRAPAPAFLISLGAAGVNGQELLARQTGLVNQPGEPDTAQIAWARKDELAMSAARLEAQKMAAAGASPAQVQLRLDKEQKRLDAETKTRSDVLFKRQHAMLEIIRQTPDNAQAQVIVANMLKQIYPALPSATAQIRAGQLTSPWYRSFYSLNPQAELSKVNCPALLLHGDADTQVPAAINLPLLEKGLKGNKHVNAKKLEGVNHRFQGPAGEVVTILGDQQQAATSADALETIRKWVFQQGKQRSGF